MAKHPIFGHTMATYAMPHNIHPLSLHAPVAHVQAVIVKYEGIVKDHSGAEHQHLLIRIEKVLSVKGGDPSMVVGEVFVATRFGDGMGLSQPIPDLQEGQSIEMQGEYIDKNHAYPSVGNPGDAVLHFTHHPVGFVKYHGVTYQ
jgi:hypothetical protein